MKIELNIVHPYDLMKVLEGRMDQAEVAADGMELYNDIIHIDGQYYLQALQFDGKPVEVITKDIK